MTQPNNDTVAQAVATLAEFADPDMHREKARNLLKMWRGRHDLSDADWAAVLEHFPPTEPDPTSPAQGWALGINGGSW
jgi:hypothetical protein